jgi:hypothetical protein
VLVVAEAGLAWTCPPNNILTSATWDFAQVSLAFSWSVRVEIALFRVATVSRSAEVAVAKLAMAVVNPASAGIGVGS